MANTTKNKDEKMVKIRLPRIPGVEKDAEFVSVNERTFLVRIGEEMEVPECVAEALRNKEIAEEELYRFKSSHAK